MAHTRPTLLTSRSRLSRQSGKQLWTEELEEMSKRLREELKDPHFVAQRCDLDGSGDLDSQELKQAASCFGLKLSNEGLQQLMDQPRISKERFAEIVKVPGPGRRCVPHSLRGMALGQLELMERIFFATGWLSQQCDAYNLLHAGEIQAGQAFQQAPNMYAMDTWIITPMSRPGPCAARSQDVGGWVPQASEESSFSELVNESGLTVHCFVSHYWGHSFVKTFEALGMWATTNFSMLGTSSPQAVVFWICLFALNQHAVADEVGEDPMHGPFNAALAQSTFGAVMVLDEDSQPFKRIWCLFEVYRLKDLQKPLELISHLGSMSNPHAQVAALGPMLKATCEALWQVKALNAEASSQKDKDRILKAIADQCTNTIMATVVGLGAPKTYAETFLSGALQEFDSYIHALLASRLLVVMCMQGHHEVAASCIEHGSRFTKQQLYEICRHTKRSERSLRLGKMLQKGKP